MSEKLKWPLSAVGFLLILFIIAELLFRYLVPMISPFDERIAVRYAAPYTMFSTFDYGTKEKEKAQGEIRIMMLGGSTVAYGNPPLPVYVERELHRRGIHGVRVLNYGVISQNSSQELAHLVFHILDSEPDLVVMYDGGNDIMDPLLYDPRPGYPFNFLAYENNVLFKDVKEYPWAALMAYGSEMFRHLFRGYFFEKFGNFSALRMAADYGETSWSEKVAEIYAGNLAKAARICSTYDVGYVAVFQPIIFYKRQAVSDVEKNILAGWPETEAKIVGPYTHDVRTRILRHISKEQKRFSFEFHDLSGIFAGSTEPVFTDYIHINDASNRKIAKTICDHLMDTVARRANKQH